MKDGNIRTLHRRAQEQSCKVQLQHNKISKKYFVSKDQLNSYEFQLT
jgi:hypothetical protein